ncbi:BTB/POZ domain-containing protein At3g22104-like [Actinidia eriantha]|uniref:BTB/POZ domain-containing protein At3g22104-like n=1 Tax=Actinidia eriantha TaxID=165200 RepID=UPI00258F4203|nr:BTB/POZ domain-containing protein At3g22104-like [Actinidia eriantha]
MEIFCNLEVDVNGEEIFFVNKKILAAFSGRLGKLFGKLAGTSSHPKVIFHDFPGGAEGFELITRFCYNNGEIEITPSNMLLLHCAANFMEMKKQSSKFETEKFLKVIQCWTWSELVLGLRQCQDLFEVPGSSSVLQKFLDLFVGRLASLNVTSPYTSSSENSNSKFSCKASSDSVKSYLSRGTCWFRDLVFLNIDLFENIIRAMVSQKLDHSMICSLLFYYLRSKALDSSPAKKRKFIETTINLLYLLDKSSMCPKGLFYLFGLALHSRIRKCYENKLEALVGAKLDHAMIDDLLVPSPSGKKYVYDVNLILRLLKSFVAENNFSLYRLKNVAHLVDLYLAEVVPDPHLKPSKFLALAMVLPDFSRDSQDRIYLAIDTYLKVHGSLCKDEKMKICSMLNYNKLSKEALVDLAKNYEFPPSKMLGARIFQQYKVKSVIEDSTHVQTSGDLPFCCTRKGTRIENVGAENTLLCA